MVAFSADFVAAVVTALATLGDKVHIEYLSSGGNPRLGVRKSNISCEGARRGK